MRQTICKAANILLSLLLVLAFASQMGVSTKAGREVSEELDLSDTSVFDTVGDAFVTKKTADDGTTYYEFLGGGTNQYNKLTTKKSYSGDITLTYDILFESIESSEMVFVTPRGSYSNSVSVNFPSSITSNFVLHTDSSGLRLSVTKSDGANARSATADKTMSVSYPNEKTGKWYSVKLVITSGTYQAKFWPSDGEEPQAFNCTLSASDGDPSEGVIGIAKRGSGKVLLRNLKVSYTQAEEDAVYSSVETPKPLRVLVGTPASALDLPTTVSVVMSDGTEKDVPVTWDTSTYQADTDGTYVLRGTLQGTQAENPESLTASITVTTYSYAYTDTLTKAAESWNGNYAGTFEEDAEGVITFGGGGTEKYNKMLSDDSYIGDIRLQFDVKFSSAASEEMLSFTPRMNPISMDTSKYEGVCGNFVLHTADSKGLRLSDKGSTQITDKTISQKSLSPTDVWYTVCFEISGNTYRLEFYPADGTEADGSGWMEYTVEQGAAAGMIAFQKRGSGTLSCRNVTVSYNEKSVFTAQSVTAPDSVRVLYDTPWSSLELPETVEVNGVGNAVKSVGVTWNESDYSATTAGTQTITGTLHLSQAQNPDGIKAEMEVIVLSQNALYTVGKIWTNGELDNVSVYHQFGTITTKDGTILATCEARVGGSDCDNPSSIVLKRSTDGGATWGETIVVADHAEDKCSDTENDCGKGIYGHFFANPTPVVDHASGAIYLFYAENFGNASSKLYYKVSRDDGMTWSSATEVTALFADDPYARAFHLAGPGHGLQIENGEYAGRLIVEVWHRHTVSYASDQRQYGLSVLYSDDGGLTWQNSEYIEVGHNMNEGRVAQLADGKLVINSRSTDNKRRQTFSTDGGAHWSTPVVWSSIGTYGNCDSGFASQVDSEQTQLITTHIKNGTTVRNTLYAFLSYDNGETWEYSALLWSDPSITTGTGASDVNRIGKDTYGAIHGTSWNGNDVEFVAFNVEYLTGIPSKTTPTTPAPGFHNITVTAGEGGTALSDRRNAAKGSVVTVTVKPEEGYEVETLTAVDKNGSALTLTANANGTYRFTMPDAEVQITVTFAKIDTPAPVSNPFVDVTESDWFYDAALWAVEQGITTGTDTTHFNPDDTCTRAELVTFLWRAAGERVVDYAMDFADVAEDAWYTEAVRWAASTGIVKGYNNGLFGTYDEITREQVVTMLYRFAVAQGIDVSVGADTNILSYTDALDIHDYAFTAMQWACGAGIVQGSGGKLMPNDTCARAQIVTMLHRLLG